MEIKTKDEQSFIPQEFQHGPWAEHSGQKSKVSNHTCSAAVCVAGS